MMLLGAGKNKFKITRKSVKYMCFILSSLVIVLFIVSIANKMLKLVRIDSETVSRTSYEALVHEYSLISKFAFDSAQAELKQFSNNPELRKIRTKDEAFEWLKKNETMKAVYFDRIGYAFVNGQCVSLDGEYDASGDKYFSDIISGIKVETAVGPFETRLGDYIVVVARPIYDDYGNVKGVISGTVKLSTLRELMEKLKIKNDGNYFLLGDDGNFICHFQDELIGKQYIPENPDLGDYSSQFFFRVRNGVYSTHGAKGQKIKVFLEAIEGTEWTCGVVVDEDVIMKSYNQLRCIIIHEVSVAALVVFILIILSTVFLNNANLWETNYDSLTKLWTRAKFEKEAKVLLDKGKNDRFAVVEIDCPGFKFINQRFGSQTADELLKQTGYEIFSYCNSRNALCGRGYADHFYIISPLENVGEFMNSFDVFVERLNESLTVKDSPVHLKYGITFYLPGTNFYGTRRSIQNLIGESSFAKSQIKNNLMQTYSIYSLQMQKKIAREGLIERQMEKALAGGEFFVVYQPKIALETDRIAGAEALVRWNSSNKELGFLAPNEFIPVFERNGFITRLDFEVYEMVFKFLRRQIDEGNPVVPISVNVSRAHRNPEMFVAEFVRRFNKYDLSPELVEIEILERSSDDDSFNLITVTNRLHEYGFSVAMDDFGSGQSSLNMLSDVPIDVIKFDQNFLRSEKAKKGQFKMINTLIELGKQLNKITLFEGVETEEQRDMLKNLKCDKVQGYFYSKPLPEKEFIEYIKNHI